LQRGGLRRWNFFVRDPVWRSGLFLLAFFCLLALGHSQPAYADNEASEETPSDDVASSEYADIAAGELGSLEDDAPVHSRRARGAPRSPPPRFVVDPSARFAIAHRFAKDLSAEIYTRGQLGAVADPLATRSSTAASGIIVNKSFGSLVWSNSIEHALHFRDFYAGTGNITNEAATALAYPYKLSSAWTVTPRISFGYRWADNARSERSKIEVMAPISYKLTEKTELTLTPRVDLQEYTRRDDGRRDWTGYVAAGVKQTLGKGLTLAVSLGYESRSSNIGQYNHTQLKLAPQINLRAEF
jgi:hypothetical protein